MIGWSEAWDWNSDVIKYNVNVCHAGKIRHGGIYFNKYVTFNYVVESAGLLLEWGRSYGRRTGIWAA